MIWKNKITKKELRHLKEVAGVTTLTQAKITFETQEGLRLIEPKTEPCYECKVIAQKLGFPV